MRTQYLLLAVALGAAGAGQAAAQQAEIGYPKGSLAYKAIAAGDYSKAERRLRSEVRVPRDDPARLLNYGYVLAKTGRAAAAASLFEQAIQGDEIELILADGRTISSREAARRALLRLKLQR